MGCAQLHIVCRVGCCRLRSTGFDMDVYLWESRLGEVEGKYTPYHPAVIHLEVGTFVL